MAKGKVRDVKVTVNIQPSPADKFQIEKYDEFWRKVVGKVKGNER